ncbi:MAG: glucose 1-dehydrogenase [Rhodospirillaceae bacterium]|jgi:2-dehydro-3-deoxy-D-gluconate 5-dehydrogenase|nr:glucose 1-dehydrogenase [Rhodospirillaceae bacterium]MBT5666901.1 glucose 1-dehydrogenase [Rhodospirillaceae bacterium]MBT5812226.1 glucose 1-dehydrogenase [Rhodospirillaceae bacterium]
MNHFNLEGRVAIVTGGNGGIGLGMAEGMASAGATLVLAGRNAEKGAAAVSTLEALGAKASFTILDVTDEAACHALIDDTVAKHGRLNVLVNNAGTNIRKEPEDYTLDEWRFVLDTNLTSAFVCCQAAFPAMKKSGGGKIINIGSMFSLFGASFSTAYAASKGGMVQMSKAMACAWAKDNIQVNTVLPGWIDTELTQGARRDVEGLHERIEARTPAGRWGRPDEFAGIAVFLAGTGSDFVTGTVIPVDGGFAAQG